MPKHWLLAWIGPLSLLSLAACSPGTSEPKEDNSLRVAASTDTGARLAVACAGCHSSKPGAIASLVGYSEDQLIERLNTYRIETDGTTVMHRLARGYSEEEIQLVSAYLGQMESD